MELWRESALFRLWRTVSAWYEDSGLCRILRGIGAWCMGQIDGSRILAFLTRERAVTTAWEGSLLCRILSWIVSLPGRLLHAWYRAWRATFEDSVCARFVFALGEGTAIAESWWISLLWIIPFAYWDNRYSLFAFASLLILFHAGAMRRRRFQLDVAHIGFLPLVFYGAVVLGLLLSYRRGMSTRFFGYHTAAALCVLVTVSAVRSASDLKRLCAGASVCVGASSVYGVITRIQGVEVVKAFVDAKLNPDMPGRVQSYFDNPNTFAEVLVILLPLTLALALCSKRTVGRIVAAGIWIVGVAALLMTYSRAGWVGFALSVVLIVFWMRPSLFPLLIAACVVAIPFLPSAVWTRILTIANMNDTTTSSRFPLYEAALRVIRRSPITGAGLGSDTVRQYIKNFNLYRGRAPFVHAHDLYLQTWLETGILGFVSLLASLYWAVVRGGRTVRRSRPSPERTIACCATAGLCGIALCAVADYPWHYPRVQVMFWYLFAVGLAAVKVCGMTRGEVHSLTRPVPPWTRGGRPRKGKAASTASALPAAVPSGTAEASRTMRASETARASGTAGASRTAAVPGTTAPAGTASTKKRRHRKRRK